MLTRRPRSPLSAKFGALTPGGSRAPWKALFGALETVGASPSLLMPLAAKMITTRARRPVAKRAAMAPRGTAVRLLRRARQPPDRLGGTPPEDPPGELRAGRYPF